LIVTLITYITELLKAIFSVKVSEFNVKISELSNKLGEGADGTTRVIGFSLGEEEGDEED
jgi:hypothetical protein